MLWLLSYEWCKFGRRKHSNRLSFVSFFFQSFWFSCWSFYSNYVIVSQNLDGLGALVVELWMIQICLWKTQQLGKSRHLELLREFCFNLLDFSAEYSSVATRPLISCLSTLLSPGYSSWNLCHMMSVWRHRIRAFWISWNRRILWRNVRTWHDW